MWNSGTSVWRGRRPGDWSPTRQKRRLSEFSYEALPSYLSGPAATEEDKMKSKNPLVVISGLVDPTVDGVRNSLQAMVPQAEIVSIQITGPDQVSMQVKKLDQANAFLILDGRRPRNGTRPLKVEVRPAQVTVDHMFDHLEQFLRIGDRKGRYKFPWSTAEGAEACITEHREGASEQGSCTSAQ